RAAGVQEADGVVPREPEGPGTASVVHARRRAGGASPPVASDSVARAARARAALRARRERVSVSLRRAIAVTRARRASLHSAGGERRILSALRAGRVGQLAVWRELELARADLVSDQLSADRGAGALPSSLREIAQGRMSHGLGYLHGPGRSGARARGASLPHLSAGCHGAAPVSRRRASLRGQS